MAWNPNIPTVTNRVQDDLNAIRENFQHLDPLAPYVQAILDSRIVEMGSNSNGTYVRFENGWQVCWFTNNPTPNFTARTEGAVSGYIHLDNWTYPAAFIANPSVVPIGGGRAGGQAQLSLNASITTLSTTRADIRLWAWNQVDADVTICRIAIGRWK